MSLRGEALASEHVLSEVEGW